MNAYCNGSGLPRAVGSEIPSNLAIVEATSRLLTSPIFTPLRTP